MERELKFKNYLVIFLGTIFGLLLLTILNYTGEASKSPNLKLIIHEDYQKVYPGNNIKATLIIYGVEKIESIHILYTIKKLGSSELTSEEEIISAEDETLHPIEFIIPKNAEPGIYQLKVKIKESESSASEIFQVTRNPKETWSAIISILIYLLILTSAITMAIVIKKNWDWLKNSRTNFHQLLFDLKWKFRRKNFFLKYFYLAIIILIIIITIILTIR